MPLNTRELQSLYGVFVERPIWAVASRVDTWCSTTAPQFSTSRRNLELRFETKTIELQLRADAQFNQGGPRLATRFDPFVKPGNSRPPIFRRNL